MESHSNEKKLMELIIDMQPLDFLALAKLLGAPVMEEKDGKEEPRSFADVLEDVLARFTKLGRTKKRDLLRLLKKSNSAK